MTDLRVVLADDAGELELALSDVGEATTVRDVLAGAGVVPTASVLVDGRAVPVDATLAAAGVLDGTTVSLPPAGGGAVDDRAGPTVLAEEDVRRLRARGSARDDVDDGPDDGGGWDRHRLAVVAGTDAGHDVPLAPTVLVGRAEDCDLRLASPTVAHHHCRVVVGPDGEVRVVDVGSSTGTWVDGERLGPGGTAPVVPGVVVRCGATALRLEEVGRADERPTARARLLVHRTSEGTVPFNRPPRPAPPPPTPPVAALPPAPGPRERAPVELAAVVVPLLLGGVLVAWTGDARYALFVLLSPLALLASALGRRQRAGRVARRSRRDHRRAVERFLGDVRAAMDTEVRRRWQRLPSLTVVRRRALLDSTRLWERRPGDAEHLVLVAGVGSVPFRPAIAAADGTTAEVTPLAREVLAAADRLGDAPVPVDLSDGGVVGIVGDRGAAVSLARSLVLQAAVHHGPADLEVLAVVAPDAAEEWGWVDWLPHTTGRSGAAPRSPVVGAAEGRALLRRLLDDAVAGGRVADESSDHRARGSEPGRSPTGARTRLLVVDGVESLRGRDAPVRDLLRGVAGPVAGVVVAATEDELPAACDTVVRCRSAHGDAVLERRADRLVVDDLLVAGLSASACRVVARRLAGLEDPELAVDATALPDRVPLLGLLGFRATRVAAGVASSWARTRREAGLRTPLGVGPDGPVWLDLVRDGPHGLVGGTTGSGKSELLRTLVAGLAARHGPDRLTVLLVDYKGGAAFDAVAGLPHVVGLVTDLDDHLGARVLRSLEAELAHRERRLRRAGVADLGSWDRLPAERRGAPLPRLVVVVDEFATLRAELPGLVDGLVGIAQRGRSLGIHLLLGTQRPAGAVDEDVRANTTVRIALRVTDDRDSTDVVGVPDAARVPVGLPGRAVLRTGPGPVTPLQTAIATGTSSRDPSSPVRVVPIGPAGRRTERSSGPPLPGVEPLRAPAPHASTAADGAGGIAGDDADRRVDGTRGVVAADRPAREERTAAYVVPPAGGRGPDGVAGTGEVAGVGDTALGTGGPADGRGDDRPAGHEPGGHQPGGHEPGGSESGRGEPGGDDLSTLVAACVAVFEESGAAAPRQPWTPPLPASVPLRGLSPSEPGEGHERRPDVSPDGAGGHAGGEPPPNAVAVGLVDVPEEQTRRLLWWRLDAGPLLVHGAVGAGTTTTVATAVVAASRRWSPDHLHVQVLDLDRGGLGPLAHLPHVGAVVTAGEQERRGRLLRSWVAEARRRRRLTAAELATEPWMVVVVDRVERLLADLDGPATHELADALVGVLADAAGLRMAPVLTTTRVGGLGPRLTAAVEQRWVHRLADPGELALVGLSRGVPSDAPPGRAVRVADGRELQVADPGDLGRLVEDIAVAWHVPIRPAPAVGVLPSAVRPGSLVDAVQVPAEGPWWVPIGRGERDLGIAGMRLHRGEHAVLLGPPGSGRTGALGGIAEVVASAGVDVLACSGSPASPLLGDGLEVVGPEELGAALATRPGTGQLLVVVDDADRVPDPGHVLGDLATAGARVHVVAAASTAVVDGDYGHWVRRLCRSRVGCFLRPAPGDGGELLGTRLPQRPPAGVHAGRGWAVSEGTVEFVQLTARAS